MSDRRFENHPALRAARVGPSRGGAQGSESTSPIRDLTVAAPLKRLMAMRTQASELQAIRDLTVAAPLKRCTDPTTKRVVGAGSSIRDLTVAAPLKR